MKSIKEKAEAYDKVLEWATEAHKVCDGMLKEDLEHLFPELKECEDEMMIQYFKDLAPFDKAEELYEKYGFSHKDAIAWLEKQCEHANFRNKIQIGDKVTRNEDGVLVNLSQLNRVAKKQTEQKLYVNDNAKEMFIKALERVEEQNNKGYKLTDCDKNSWWEDFKAYTSCTVEQKPAAWSDEDEKMLVEIVHDLQVCKSRDISRVAKDAYQNEIDWLKSLKDRVQPQPKQEWSEEDEQTFIKSVEALEDFGKFELADWLKEHKNQFLKPQNTWKPSDEQMNNK